LLPLYQSLVRIVASMTDIVRVSRRWWSSARFYLFPARHLARHLQLPRYLHRERRCDARIVIVVIALIIISCPCYRRRSSLLPAGRDILSFALVSCSLVAPRLAVFHTPSSPTPDE
jgi:hypothetical protein